MEDKIQHKKVRKYNDKSNRTEKINRTTILSLTFIELILILGLFIQTFVYKTAFGKLGIIPIIILILGIFLNCGCYFHNKKSEKLKYYMFFTFFIGWTYLMILGSNILVSFYIYPLIIATILYYDKKFETMLFYSILIVTAIRTIVWAVSGQLFGGDSVSFISIVVHIEIIIVLHSISKLSNRFSGDMLGAAQDEKNVQTTMVNQILQISNDVQDTVADTNDLIDHLKTDASLVHDSIEDISDRTQKNVDSVQEQNQMTQQINADIEDTSENAKVMVEAATKSSQLLEENMAVIASIRNDADSITETNGNKYCTAVY